MWPDQLLLWQTAGAIFASFLLILLWNGFKWRAHIHGLRASGLPMPPWNPVFGHLGIAASIASKLPSDAHGHYLPDQIRRLYPDLGPNFYLDLYPMAPSMLVLGSPDTLYQITQAHSLPKFSAMRKFLRPLTGNLDIVTMEGQVWKKWRKVFNPGFSAAHLMSLVPVIVREAETFVDILHETAERRDVVRMKDLTDNLTMDVIGRVVMDTHFDCQRRPNAFVDRIRRQIRWLSFGAEPNLFVRYHPLRPLAHWYYSRMVNAFMQRELDQRVKDYINSEMSLNKSKTIMDLAIGDHLAEIADSRKQTVVEVDPLFKKVCAAQIKLFLFGGHDTTSSSICYLLYLLSVHPTELRRLRDEHDLVLTKDSGRAAGLISENPSLLNQLPYTLAVIKESLRLFPVVSSTRAGEPGFCVIDNEGRRLPTNDFLVWTNPHNIQHDPKLWPRSEEFVPGRWLVDAADPLYPLKGAWRAFEHGPRNCIGQELAMIEMKVVLCLFARTLEIRDCYAELDERNKTGAKKVNGERAYQVQLSQPEGDLPCRIHRVAVDSSVG